MTCLRQYLQRIDIEKALSIQRHAAEHAIIKCAFHNVCIPCLRRDFQHSPRKKDKTDRRTGFRIRRVVRQIVGIGERLAQMGAADSACNVHFFSVMLSQSLRHAPYSVSSPVSLATSAMPEYR